MKDLVIIGSGPAGIYAGFLAGLKKLNTVIVESADQHGGQLSLLYPNKLIFDLPGFKEISAKNFIDLLYAQYEIYKDDVPLLLDQKAIHIIDHHDYYVIKTTRRTIMTKTVLIAHGGGTYEPRKIDYIEKNIYYYMHDLETVANQDVVILGGGDSAIDYALMIQDVVKSLSIIHRRVDFRASPASLDKLKNHVTILTPYNIDNIDDQLIYLSNKNENKTIIYDKLFVFYGSVKGRSQLMINDDIIDDKIVVDSKMSTKYKNIFAVGNSCTYDGKLTVVTTALGEVTTAIGKIADLIYPERNNHEYSSLRRTEKIWKKVNILF